MPVRRGPGPLGACHAVHKTRQLSITPASSIFALRALAAFALFACATGAAPASSPGTLSGVSDYRYRGNTLTDGMPAAQAGVTYDDPKGWYAGAFGSTVRLKPPGGARAGVYPGYRLRRVSNPGRGRNQRGGGRRLRRVRRVGRARLGEVFLGVATDSVSAKVYYSPRYLGECRRVYGEINARSR